MGRPNVSAARHVAVLTGKRGGYGAMKPMLRALDDDPDIRFSLLVTDQHVSERFGYTIKEIEKEFAVTAAVDMEQSDGSPAARARALGTCLNKMAGVLADLDPDILVLYGDRGEVLATATAAVTLRIPIAHLQGGDISGNVDEVMRHAMTKLSHLHFPSTKDSAARIVAMGEEPWRVRAVGDNHIDPIVAGDYSDAAEVRTRFAIPADEEPLVVLLHPETTRIRDGHQDMSRLLEAVLAEGRRTIIVYPCSDHGYDEIVRAIHEVQGRPQVSIHKNIDAPDFWGLLAISGAMIGNSSAGLIETPYFNLPAVNVGERQKGRQHGNNVIHCDFAPDALRAAVRKALHDDAFRRQVADCERPFGDGYAWCRIVETLKSVELGDRLIDKTITY